MKYATVKLTMNIENSSFGDRKCKPGGSYICPAVLTCDDDSGCGPDRVRGQEEVEVRAEERGSCTGNSCRFEGNVMEVEARIKEDELMELTKKLQELVAVSLLEGHED